MGDVIIGDFTAEEFLDQYETPKGVYLFLTRSEPGERLARARQALAEAREQERRDPDDPRLGSEVAGCEADVEEAEADVAAATRPFEFEALPRPEWSALKDKHEPTEKQIRDKKRKGQPAPEWNEDSFPPAAIAACMRSPRFDVDQAKRLWATGTEGETWSLFIEIGKVNGQRREGALGKGSAPTQD